MKWMITKFWRWWYHNHPGTSRFTREKALARAKAYGLEAEVQQAIEHGCTPDEALQEWDIYPSDGQPE